MIVIDTSALIAILNCEPERGALYEAIAAAAAVLSAPLIIKQVPLSRRGVNGLYDLQDFLALIGAEVVPHDGALAEMAILTFQRFGKGIDPKARLNFCDCAAYALAMTMNAPLLFKGDDFIHTDVARV
jgi:ribonuclease VapC